MDGELEPGDDAGLSAGLSAFLTGNDLGATHRGEVADGPQEIAAQVFVVEQIPRGGARSRLVEEGGVRFVRAASYRLTLDDLPPIASRREGIEQSRLQMVKFAFTFSELPPNRSYAEVRVRIALKPVVSVLQLRPYLKNADSQSTRSFSTEFAPAITKLLQLEMKASRSVSTNRTEIRPVATAFDLGAEGFGWTFQAQEGAPLFPRTEYTVAVLETPLGTAQLDGLFDAEAIITRRILGTFEPRRVLPPDSPVAFTLPLSS
ncbi:MAG TPA: hypothetical protein VGH27_32625 [Streptosporangiaceae bacterium]|jgi:hypothetical protein